VVPGALAKEVVDTTGAGDAFLGGLLAGLRHELGWEEAARLANACGAACVEQLGAFPADPELARRRVLELYSGGSGGKVELGAFRGRVASREPHPAAAGLAVLECGAREMQSLRGRHDGEALVAAAEIIEAAERKGGRVHVTGVGKAEHVAHYAASLFSSTGVPAAFLHSTEAMHGSLGQVVAGDIVIAISNSGCTEELGQVVDSLAKFDAPVVAVTGGLDSRLARSASAVLDAAVCEEGGPLGLAPRASVAAEILVIAALGALLQARRDFGHEDYARFHPAGELGRRAHDD
jgi:D-arabinose 5-phosphate isomerase GutQ